MRRQELKWHLRREAPAAIRYVAQLLVLGVVVLAVGLLISELEMGALW